MCDLPRSPCLESSSHRKCPERLSRNGQLSIYDLAQKVSVMPSGGTWLQGNYNRERERTQSSSGSGQAVAARSGVASTLSSSLSDLWTRHSLQAVAGRLRVSDSFPKVSAQAELELAHPEHYGQQGQGHTGVVDRFTTAAAT